MIIISYVKIQENRALSADVNLRQRGEWICIQRTQYDQWHAGCPQITFHRKVISKVNKDRIITS
jgi:hypothetical protein